MTSLTAITGSEIFDGHSRHAKVALLIEGGKVTGMCPIADVPDVYDVVTLDGGLIAPGLVDVQVNGGGGVMLNNSPDAATIRKICAAHLGAGTTSVMATLITDTPEQTTRAISAAIATAGNVTGMIGLHLEGPHLSKVRKGAHDADLIRTMTHGDQEQLVAAASELPSLLVTVAPESVSDEQVRSLAKANVIISIGHSDAGFATVQGAASSGATCVTHLFNAMSQLQSREPGMVGAALANGALFTGIIADGIHVNAASLQIALRAKQGPGKIFLISDAMATVGTDIREFDLNGRRIFRRDGRLTLKDGTLAGADIDLIGAVRYLARELELPLDEALRMASLYPAQLLKRDAEIGNLAVGCQADFIHLDEKSVQVRDVWKNGVKV